MLADLHHLQLHSSDQSHHPTARQQGHSLQFRVGGSLSVQRGRVSRSSTCKQGPSPPGAQLAGSPLLKLWQELLLAHPASPAAASAEEEAEKCRRRQWAPTLNCCWQGCCCTLALKHTSSSSSSSVRTAGLAWSCCCCLT